MRTQFEPLDRSPQAINPTPSAIPPQAVLKHSGGMRTQFEPKTDRGRRSTPPLQFDVVDRALRARCWLGYRDGDIAIHLQAGGEEAAVVGPTGGGEGRVILGAEHFEEVEGGEVGWLGHDSRRGVGTGQDG